MMVEWKEPEISCFAGPADNRYRPTHTSRTYEMMGEMF
jgi:hypothetical protein